MHYTLHVVHPADVVVEEYITEKMAPYHEDLEVPEYKVYYSDKEIARARSWYAGRGFEKGDDITDVVPYSWNGCHTYTDDKGHYRLSTSNPQGYWDWWRIGGRWNDYWGSESEKAVATETGTNTVSVAYALSRRPSGKHEWMRFGPYAYLTLDGKFIKKETYNPDGEGYDEGDPDSMFPPNPEYDYWKYLEEVGKMIDIAVTVVDYHC